MYVVVLFLRLDVSDVLNGVNFVFCAYASDKSSARDLWIGPNQATQQVGLHIYKDYAAVARNTQQSLQNRDLKP